MKKKKVMLKKTKVKKIVKSRKNKLKVKKVLHKNKNKKIGLSKSFIDECKKKLIEKYNELVNINYKNEELIPEVGDDIDLAKIALDKEILQELTDTQQNLLSLISIALEKIEKGNYGQCERCKKSITMERLKVLPWARNCINCQTNEEHS